MYTPDRSFLVKSNGNERVPKPVMPKLINLLPTLSVQYSGNCKYSDTVLFTDLPRR